MQVDEKGLLFDAMDERTSLLQSSQHDKSNDVEPFAFYPSTANGDKAFSGIVDEANNDVVELTFWSLLRNNPKYCLYLASYTTNFFGAWLTYLSSLSAIQVLLKEQDDNHGHHPTQTLISFLVVIRLMTFVLFSPLGGVLADGWDRRWIMIALDIIGALGAWMFVLAVSVFHSVPLILVATAWQMAVSGLYAASRTAILPLLVDNDEEKIKKATILSGMAWSGVSAFGSAVGGFLVSVVGMNACFMLDSLTYVLSAGFMLAVGPGQWNVSKQTTNGQEQPNHYTNVSLLNKVIVMMWDGMKYLVSSAWGPLVFFKFSAMLMTVDVVNVKLASQNGTGDDDDDDSAAFFRLGLLFAASGVGSCMGPLVGDRFTTMHQPQTLQVICIISIGITAVACLLMGIPDIPFGWLCAITAIRAMGQGVVWVNSSLLLQILSAPNLLGRVVSLDGALALIGQSLSALVVGRLEDRYAWTATQVCYGLGLLGVGVLLTGWTLFHFLGGGGAAAAKRFR